MLTDYCNTKNVEENVCIFCSLFGKGFFNRPITLASCLSVTLLQTKVIWFWYNLVRLKVDYRWIFEKSLSLFLPFFYVKTNLEGTLEYAENMCVRKSPGGKTKHFFARAVTKFFVCLFADLQQRCVILLLKLLSRTSFILNSTGFCR